MISSQSPAQNPEQKSHPSQDEESITLPIDKMAAIATSESSDSRLEAKEEPEGPREQRTAPAAIRYDDLFSFSFPGRAFRLI